MSKKIYCFLCLMLVLGTLFQSCTNTTNDGENSDKEEDGPVLHQLDPSAGYCYQNTQLGVEEVFQLTITGNKIAGEGIRIYSITGSSFRLRIEGVFTSANEADVTVYAEQEKGNATVNVSHQEVWTFLDNRLEINGRKLKNAEGDFYFIRIYCPSKPNKDSTLYHSFGGFSEGYAVVSKFDFYGVVDKDWNVVIPMQYKDLGQVLEGKVTYYDENEVKWGFLDLEGNVLLPPKHVELMGFSEGRAAFLDDNGFWGFYDENLNVALQPIYDNVNFYKPDVNRKAFNEGLANVKMQGAGWNYINRDGEVVIGGDFVLAGGFKNGEAKVYGKGEYYINKSGKCVRNCPEE